MRSIARNIPTFGVLLLLASPAASTTLESRFQNQDPGWSIRFYAASIDFDNTGHSLHGSRPDYEIDIGFGIGVNAEYRLSRRLGLDLGVLGGAAADVAWESLGGGDWVWTAYDTLTFTPLTAGLDIHLTPDSNVDLFICPMLAWIHYGGIVVHSASHWTGTTTIEFEEDLGVGVTLGLGAPFGARGRWFFVANLTHLESRLDGIGAGGGRLAGDYGATIFGLGLGHHF